MSDIRNGPRPGAGGSSFDDVASLVRLAGRRPAVPPEHAAAVRAAARAEWRRVVEARRRKALYLRGGGALLATAALLVLAVKTGLWRPAEPRPVAQLATLEAATGPVTADAAELRVGDPVPAGTVLETGSDGASPARAALRLAGGASVRLDVDTRLRLAAGSVLELERGAVYVDSGTLAQQLEVRTPLGIARDVGTRFEVRLGPGAESLRVRVRDGEVVLERDGESRPAAPRRIGAGGELAVLPDGTAVEATVPSWGPAWEWVAAIPPPFDVEGRSLQEFLDWAAEEGGWELRFADQAVADQASANVLHGSSIDGLSLEDAASLLLTASELSYRLEDGVFLVTPAG